MTLSLILSLFIKEQTRKEGEKIGKIEMKCMNAYIKFRFSSNDIKELHLSSPSGKYIAAEKVMFTPDMAPTATDEPASLIQQAGFCGAYSLVIIPENGTFEAGVDYYAAALPEKTCCHNLYCCCLARNSVHLPALRYPKKSSGSRFSSIFSTAAEKAALLFLPPAAQSRFSQRAPLVGLITR